MPRQTRSWFSHVIAIIKNRNGELTEEVVRRDVLDDGPAETEHGPIVEVRPVGDAESAEA